MTVRLIKIYKNNIINNKKGDLVKYVSRKNFFFKKFGEIYFNHIKLKKTKGWNYHRKNTCLLICVWGKVKFHFVDKNGKERKIILDSKLGKILKLPPKIWFSFKSLKTQSIIANLIENPHRDSEVIKKNKIKNYLIR